MQHNIKKILALVISVMMVSIPSFSQITLTSGAGYLDQPPGVVTYLLKKEGVTDATLVPGLTNAEKTKSIDYVDGFGRPLQSILVAGSPNSKDIVSFARYDEFGRQTKQYLPYEATTSDGTYTGISTTESNQLSFYSPSTSNAKKITGDNSPFAQSSFETSPLQRVLKVGGVGDGFQLTEHYKTMSYRTGMSSDAVRKWDLGSSNATSTSSYGDYDLSVSEVVDENSVHASVFKDKFGRLILKRQDAPSSGYYDTYYVYDNVGNIIYIVPPKAITKMAGSSTYNTSSYPELIYQFWYDSKNRINQKKVPGAKEVYIVYDPLGRIVLTQDGNMRASSGTKWAYVKYDNANRVIIQGIYDYGSVVSQDYMQNTVVKFQSCYSGTSYYEVKQSGTSSGYSNQCFPTSNTEERAYGYFDNYDFNADGTPDYSKSAQGLTGEAIATDLTYGLATGSKRKILNSGTPGTWITDVSFYDKYYHVIQVRSSNQLDNSVNDHTTNVVTFTGKVTEAKQYKSLSSQTVTVGTKYEYDDMERLTKVKQTNPGASEVTVAKYEYNALGQLVDKKLHSTNGTDYLQSVDMRYNIRGQLISINNSARNVNAANNDETNDVFGMEILYNTADGDLGNTASYTGMISGVKWSAKTPSDPTPGERGYKYTYDKVYRLTAGDYWAKSSGGTVTTGGFNESFSYDEGGNITGLQRYAILSGTTTLIDNLTYTYKSSDIENQLDNISDAVTLTTTGYGYINYTSSSSAYTYDDNGNLKTDPKKGTVITYNELNKPTMIKNSANSSIYVSYTYDAAGTRLTKYIHNGSSTQTIDYVGGYVVTGGALSYYGMAEGRVRLDVGFSGTTYKMEYFITDHQGNTRVSFEDNGSGTAIVSQENSYYAFGMQMAGGYSPTYPNKKLYNAGSEWQDDIAGLADYYSTFYREYDPIIGRFNGVDPLAIKTPKWSPYAYANDNPVNYNDPNGDRALTQQDIDQLLSSKNGGHWNANTGLELFGEGDDDKAFSAGSNYMDIYGLWGTNGFASSLGGAKSAYFKLGGQNNEVWGVQPTIFVKARNNRGKLEITDISWDNHGGKKGTDGWSALGLGRFNSLGDFDNLGRMMQTGSHGEELEPMRWLGQTQTHTVTTDHGSWESPLRDKLSYRTYSGFSAGDEGIFNHDVSTSDGSLDGNSYSIGGKWLGITASFNDGFTIGVGAFGHEGHVGLSWEDGIGLTGGYSVKDGDVVHGTDGTFRPGGGTAAVVLLAPLIFSGAGVFAL